MQFTLKMLTTICLSLFVVTQIEGKYVNIPSIIIEALKPQGLRVSISDEKSSSPVKFVEFHANVNEDIDVNDKAGGHIFNRISAPHQGEWTFTDKSVALKKGDVLNYWILLWMSENEAYKKHGLTYKVEDLVSE